MTARAAWRRVGQSLVVLIAAFTLAFVLLHALPSDAVTARFGSDELGLSDAELEEIRRSMGLDRPVVVPVFVTLVGFLTGDWGYSVQTGTQVTTLLAENLPATLALAGLAFVVAVALALGLTLAAALPQAAWLRSAARALPPLVVSVPLFLIAIVLIQVLSFQLGWVPVINPEPWQRYLMPTVALSLPIAGPLAQVFIRSVDEVYREPHVAVTRARGAGRSWLFFRSVARAALLPAVTMAGLLFGELVGGTVVVEEVFGIDGVGRLTVEAVANRDTPVLMAVVVIAAFAYIVINLVVDLLYPLLDARVRRPSTL